MAFEPHVDPPKSWAPSGAGLTYTQLRLIGQIITNWSVLEIVLQQIMMLLTQSPHELGQALTEDLGPDHRLKALDRLCRHWQKHLEWNHPEHESLALIAEARTFVKWIRRNKDLRNRYAHWSWLRADDGRMFCNKYTLKWHAADSGEIDTFAYVTNDETEAFANEIAERGDQLIKLVKALEMRLPTWPQIRA